MTVYNDRQAKGEMFSQITVDIIFYLVYNQTIYLNETYDTEG